MQYCQVTGFVAANDRKLVHPEEEEPARKDAEGHGRDPELAGTVLHTDTDADPCDEKRCDEALKNPGPQRIVQTSECVCTHCPISVATCPQCEVFAQRRRADRP